MGRTVDINTGRKVDTSTKRRVNISTRKRVEIKIRRVVKISGVVKRSPRRRVEILKAARYVAIFAILDATIATDD